MYRFKVVGDTLVCYRKELVPIATMVYVNNPDANDLFSLLDAYASHTSELPLRLTNIQKDDPDIQEWLKGKHHEWKGDKLFVYKSQVLPESSEG